MVDEYTKEWCNERHKGIDKEFKAVWGRLKTLEARLWAIIILLVFNLGIAIMNFMHKASACIPAP